MPIHEQTFELAETAIDFVKAAVEGVLGDALTIEQLKQHEQTMHDIALPTPVQVDRNRPSLDDMHRCMTLERHYNVVLRRVMFLQNKHLQNTLADLASRVNPNRDDGDTNTVPPNGRVTRTENGERRSYTEDEYKLLNVMKGLKIEPPDVFEGKGCGIDPHAWVESLDPFFAYMAQLGGEGYELPVGFKIKYLNTRLGKSGKMWFQHNQERVDFVAATSTWAAFKTFFVYEMSVVDQRSIDRKTVDSIKYTSVQQLYTDLTTLRDKVGQDPNDANSLPPGLLARMFESKLPSVMQLKISEVQEQKRTELMQPNYTLDIDDMLKAAMFVEKANPRFATAAQAHHGLHVIDDNVPEAPPTTQTDMLMSMMSDIAQGQQALLNAIQPQVTQQSYGVPHVPQYTPPALPAPPTVVSPPTALTHGVPQPVTTIPLSPAQLHHMYGDDYMECMPCEEEEVGDAELSNEDNVLFALLQRNHRAAQRMAMQAPSPGGGTGSNIHGSGHSLPPRLQGRIRCHNCGQLGHMMRNCDKPLRFKRTNSRLMKRRPQPGSRNLMMRQPRFTRRTRNFRATGQPGHQQLNVLGDDEQLMAVLPTVGDDELVWSVDPDVTQPFVYA